MEGSEVEKMRMEERIEVWLGGGGGGPRGASVWTRKWRLYDSYSFSGQESCIMIMQPDVQCSAPLRCVM